jgi:hypothetical protein
MKVNETYGNMMKQRVDEHKRCKYMEVSGNGDTLKC